MKAIFLAIFLGLFLLFPVLTQAAGLIPCGEPGNPCQLCHLFVLFNNIYSDLLLILVTPIAILMATLGGIFLLFSAGNPQKVNQGKAILTATAIGIIIIFLSYGLLNAFLMSLEANTWTGWFPETGVAEDGGTDYLLDEDKNWGTDELKDHTISIVEGNGKGQTRKIVSNVSNTVFVDSNWLITPSDTSEYKIGGNLFQADCPVR